MDKISMIEKAMERAGSASETAVSTPAASDQPAFETAPPVAETSVTRALDVGRPEPAQAAPARTPRTVHIDLERLEKMHYITHDGERTLLAEEYRLIKRPLLENAFGKNADLIEHGNLIMVTSARAGEGKTFTSVNLAMSIAAERDHGVLLIDADVARPTIPRELGIHADVGLMDWLIDGGPDISQLVLQTNIETLSLLPAGRHDQHATEWLASEAMGRLLDELSRRYPQCVLIFDSPPLLVTTEARVLASYMGQIVMVVESGRTPREAVTQALSTIESNEIVGLVLNKAHNIESNGYYQGYGYGYGYGYGASGSS